MQAVEDIWTCNRCGWTYPNHHPSAKHRRNHKKVCGKIPGHTNGDHHDHVHGGSSDEASSGDDNHQAVLGSTPVVTPAVGVESQSRSFDFSAALQKSETEAPAAAAAIEEPAAAPLDGAKAIVQQAPQAESADEGSQLEDTHKPVLGSAVPHPEEDIWICRACGWTYPNAHPSAKHRRNHNKHCPGKAGAVVHALGGSSDDDSDGEHHAPKGNSEKVSVTAPAPTVVEREAEKSEARPTPILSSTRELCFESLMPKGATPEDVSKKVETAHIVATTASASAHGAVVEAPTTSTPPAAPTVLPKVLGSSLPHPEGEAWKCRHCDWTYPNAHPSAKHRRNHKKHCPGEGAVKGGSSDDDSDQERKSSVPAKEPTPFAATAPTEAVASASREFQLPKAESKAEVSTTAPPAVKVEKPKVEAPAAHKVEEPKADAPAAHKVEEPKVETPAAHKVEETKVEAPDPHKQEEPKVEAPAAHKVEAPKVEVPAAHKLEDPKVEAPFVPPAQPQHEAGEVEKSPHADATPDPKGTSSGPHQEDPNDIWICSACGWTYPNAHPSAKHRRNHKKHCPGKSAAVGHAPGGSSDDDSDDGSSRRGPNSTAASEAAPAELLVVKERAMPGIGVRQPNTATQVEMPKAEVTARAPLAQLVSDEQRREQEAKSKEELKSSAVPKAAKAVYDSNVVWICKECGWTYPNPHPSAKHRRNHKKVCKKTKSTGGGSSSDASSGDEHVGHFGKKKCFPCL